MNNLGLNIKPYSNAWQLEMLLETEKVEFWLELDWSQQGEMVKNKFYSIIFLIITCFVLIWVKKKMDMNIYITNITQHNLVIVGFKSDDSIITQYKSILPNEKMMVEENKLLFEKTVKLLVNKDGKDYEFLIDEYYLNDGRDIFIKEVVDDLLIDIYNFNWLFLDYNIIICLELLSIVKVITTWKIRNW